MCDRVLTTILLDAMGVLYRAGDDVAELLVPFIQERNPDVPVADIEASYLMASLGQLTAADFWKHFGLDPSVEDEYLKEHRLQDGVLDFLCWAQNKSLSVSCLSNDVSEWSQKLRRWFGLEEKIQHWIISGDVHVRKPKAEIYQCFLQRSGMTAATVLFVDDRIKNVDAARAKGFEAVLFGTDQTAYETHTPMCTSFRDLQSYCKAFLQ